jgi:hypothetical protein
MIAATHVTHANPSIELWLLFIHANQGYAVRTRPHVPFWTYAKDFFFTFSLLSLRFIKLVYLLDLRE